MLENLSSLLESLAVLNQTEISQESMAQTLDDLIPSLLKIRRLAGMPFSFMLEFLELIGR